MAKELPFFKFEPNQWDAGNIQMCSRASKGLFTDMCSLYWSRLGELPYALALQKLCNGIKDEMQELIDNEIIGVIDGHIVIEFLDEQLSEFSNVSEKRRKAAEKRWKDASALQVQSKSNAIREEKKREEKKREEESENAREVFLVKDFEWFKKQIDEIWLDQLPSEKKQNFPRALQEAWAHLSADELRLHNAGSKECKQLLNTWLSRMKPEKITDGTLKIINDKLKSDALIKAKYAAKAAASGENRN